MKLDGIRDQYYFYSGKISDLVRQLALAGIAVIWIFKIDKPGLFPSLPRFLIWPMLALVLALFVDFVQYSYGATLYDITYRWRERQKQHRHMKEDHSFEIPRFALWPMDLCFYSKIAFVLIAYTLLAIHILKQFYVQAA
jgi:hypothetical protein